jgi:fermentation-respiration switch protein FrsA (DUF1100 family)
MSPTTATPASTPALPFRAGVLLVAALLLQGLWWTVGIVTPAEKFHLTLPFLWLIDFALARRHRLDRPWRAYLPAALLACGAAWVFCWLLLLEQARQIGGRVAWSESLWKVLFIASIFIMYSMLAQTLSWLLTRIPAVRSAWNQPRGWGWRLLRQSFSIILFAPYLFTTFHIHRSKIANSSNPRQELGLNFEEVRFAASDGERISGWFIPAGQSRRTVVVCHGVGANKSNFMGVAPFLHRAGWNVLLFDFRGHGDSGGHTTSFGYLEGRDVVGAVSYLQKRGLNEVALYGFSMGGSSVLHAIPQLPQIRAVIVDSTFAQLAALAQAQTAFLPGWLQGYMTGSMELWTHLEIGIGPSRIEPQRYVAQITPRPLLIVHGLADELIPPHHAHANFAAARQPKTLWLVNGANHCECRVVDEKPYEARVTRFLRDAFAGRT